MKLEKKISWHAWRKKYEDSRFLENVVLNLFLLSAILEHLGERFSSAHTTTQTSANVGGVHMFVQLIRVSDPGCVKSLSRADKGPERSPVCLSNDIWRDAISTSVPAGWYLASNGAAEREGLGNKDASSPFELDEPLLARACPNIAFVAVLVLELLSLGLGDLNRLQIMRKLDFLIEDLLLGVVSTEEFRF
jgi:hypothetical protein